MKKIFLNSMLVLSLGLFVTSCNETKKEAKEQVQEVEKSSDKVKSESTEQNHSDEMAMSTYQCPMKCEGDKTYDKPGTCPTCKMDLKKVEASHNDDKDKGKMSEKENHDGNDHD